MVIPVIPNTGKTIIMNEVSLLFGSDIDRDTDYKRLRECVCS
jgi:hypothetical protein